MYRRRSLARPGLQATVSPLILSQGEPGAGRPLSGSNRRAHRRPVAIKMPRIGNAICRACGPHRRPLWPFRLRPLLNSTMAASGPPTNRARLQGGPRCSFRFWSSKASRRSRRPEAAVRCQGMASGGGQTEAASLPDSALLVMPARRGGSVQCRRRIKSGELVLRDDAAKGLCLAFDPVLERGSDWRHLSFDREKIRFTRDMPGDDVAFHHSANRIQVSHLVYSRELGYPRCASTWQQSVVPSTLCSECENSLLPGSEPESAG